MKIAVYGIGYYSDHFLERLKCATRKVDIVYFVESVKTKEEFHGCVVKTATEMNPDDFDYLVIAVINHDVIWDYIKEALDCYEQLEPKILIMSQFLHIITRSPGGIYPYGSVKLSCGLSYIFDSEDRCIGYSMVVSGENYARGLIDSFFVLTDKYYGARKRTGIFLDIGANIGTTAIYVKKIVNPYLNVIGIEAGKKNFDIFRINCIINDVESICIENVGFGDKNKDMNYCYCIDNPGGSGVVENKVEGAENVRVITMDSYCDRNGIAAKDIDYIWMDTEGFEAQIIEGGKSIFSEVKIPLLQEFNPTIYRKRGVLSEYCKLMNEYYDSFIDMMDYERGNYQLRNIGELFDYSKKMEMEGRLQADLFFA